MNGVKSMVLKAAVCMTVSLGIISCGFAETIPVQSTAVQNYMESASYSVAILSIAKHGNVKLDTTFDQLKTVDIEVGDIITVSVNGSEYDMPVGTSFSDVDSGQMFCRFDTEQNEVELCINSGSFAEATGIAVRNEIAEDPGYRWEVLTDSVDVRLKEKQGYADEYSVRQLERSNERGDYPSLTDAEFANFRSVSAEGLKANMLYRSSSPLDPSLGRSEYAMTAMKEAGIKTVLNLADTANSMKEYDAFGGSYYGTCNILNISMGYDFISAEFAEAVKECVLFINENEGPYLIHCKEGKDRTGMVCAILSCFSGAAYDEVLNDYMLTYENFYGVKKGTESYDTIVRACFNKNLEKIFGIDNIETADLKDAAAKYLSGIGLTESDLEALKDKLAA